METLKNYVNWKLAHSDKTATAEGYPLVMENCKTNKRMKQLEVYGDCFQRLGSKNLLPYPYYRTTATINGVTFTDNGDGSITVNGTATADAVYYLYVNNTTLIPGTKKGDTITGSIFSDKEWDASVEKLCVVLNYYNANTTMKDGVILNPSNKTRTFTITDDWYGMGFNILVSKGGVVDNITLRVQIELGETATEYEPYILSPSPDCPSEVQSVGDIFNSITKVSQGTSTFTFLQKWKDVSKIRLTAKINTSMIGRNHILFCTKGGSWIGLDKTNYTTNTWNFMNGFTNTSANILPDKFINNEINTIEFSFNNTNDTYISNVWDAAWSAEITYYRIQFYDSLNSLIGDYYPISLYMMYDTVSETTITASQKSQYNNYTEQYKVPIKIRGKNLLDGSFLSKISSITYQDGWYQGSAYSLLYYTTKNKNISGFFKPNTQYTFSWTVNTKATGLCFVVYYTDGTYSRLANASSTNTDLYLTGASKVGKSIDYVTIDYGSNGTCKIKNLQIEEGIIATEYEPYVEPITQNIYLDEPMRKIEEYVDYIDFKNKRVIRNIFKDLLNIHHIDKKVTDVVRFDGYKSSTLRAIPNSIILSYIFPSKKSDWIANRESIFNHTTSAINWYWSIFWNRLGLTYDGTNVYRTDDTEQTPLTDSEIVSIANEWIATLSDRDKTIYRVRETPTEEDISCQLPKTLAKTTIIDVDTTLLPSNIKGKYVIK